MTIIFGKYCWSCISEYIIELTVLIPKYIYSTIDDNSKVFSKFCFFTTIDEKNTLLH